MHVPLTQLVRYCDRSGRSRLLALDRFADNSSKEAWDYSAWVRAYSLFLTERLDAFRCVGRAEWAVGGANRQPLLCAATVQ